MKMLQPVSEEININFMFSIMNQIRFSLGDDHKRRWIAEYNKIDVFIPEISSVNRSNSREIRPTFINVDNPWILIVSNGFIEEAKIVDSEALTSFLTKA